MLSICILLYWLYMNVPVYIKDGKNMERVQVCKIYS